MNYFQIPGLDMMTHAKFAKDFLAGQSNFSCYKLFCASIIALAGCERLAIFTAAFQMLLGILPALMAVFTTLHLTRNRTASLLAGTLAALYSTSISYELFLLPESIFLLACSATLSLPCLLAWRRYDNFYIVLSGAICSLPMLTRFSGLLLSFAFLTLIFAKLAKKAKQGQKFAKRAFCLAGGFGTPLAVAILFNAFAGQSIAPIASIPNISYVAKIGSTENIKSLSTIEKDTPDKPTKKSQNMTLLKNYAEKFFMIFHHYEIPNNINCYFLRYFIPSLKYCINSAFLLPFATAGMLIVLFRNGFLSKYFPLFLFIFCLAIPMTVFVPLARYRIAILPALWIFAVQIFVLLDAKLASAKFAVQLSRPLISSAFLAAALIFSIIGAGASAQNFRSEDMVAYGLASEKMERGRGSELAENSYRTALELRPDSKSAAIHLSNLLMKNARFEEAFNILFPIYMRNATDKTISINFASSLLGLGRAVEAEKVLERLGEPEGTQSKMRFYYQLAEAFRLQGRFAEAILAYQKSLDNASSELEKQIILHAVKQISPNTK